MSQERLLLQLISSLQDNEFDRLIKLYLQEVDGISNVIRSNGPYDSGLDFRPTEISKIEIQYQATTKEKNFEQKFYQDVEKAQRNVVEYGLPPKVKYFYSHTLSNTAILRKTAKERHEIIVEIIDANALAEIASGYDSIRNLLFRLADIDNYTGQSDFFDDSKVKAFYDLMSFGKSTDIKYNIIKSHVLNFLFANGPTSVPDVLTSVNKHFGSKFDKAYFESFLRRISTEKKIQMDSSNGNIELTSTETDRISEVLKRYKIEEAVLRRELADVLKEYKIEDCLDEMIVKLAELYESNYSINLGEFLKRSSTINDLRTATHKFNEYLKSKINDSNVSETLAKKLFMIADKNEILSRITAGKVYSKVSEPDRLQEYITQNNNNKDIILDTNFLINALCIYYDPKINYDKYYFKVAKQFLSFAKKNDLHLKTLRGYAVETASLFKEALAIIPFTKLKVFEALGGSKNILHTFFTFLKDWNFLHEGTQTFEEFLNEFGFKRGSGEYDSQYFSQIEFLLEEIGVEVENPPKYDLNKAKSIIFNDLRDGGRHKSLFAVNNDAIMLMRLGDPNVEVNPLDPIFCTWDLSLIRVRKKFFEEFPKHTKWLMYTPTRLMDHYSMMNFQVKEGSLSNEVLSILDEDFSFQEKTQSLLDAMLIVINPENEVGLKYTNRLAELRKREIIQIDQSPESIPDDGSESTNAVDVVFKMLFQNYAMQSEEGRFDTFKALFTKEDLFEDMFEILSTEVNYVNSNRSISSDLITRVDAIMGKVNASQ